MQNLLALHFGNRFIAKTWDRDHIEYIKITVAETVGVEGRAEYLDNTGVVRDMVQNHLMQLLSLIALEPPTSLQTSNIRREKIKLLQCLRPITAENVHQHAVIAQYSSGDIDGHKVPAYRDEIGDLPGTAETFIALRLFINKCALARYAFLSTDR